MAEGRPIVVKRKASHSGPHGGAWKVAYADFVTAMMALFIVLWLMNTSKQIQQAVGGYFKDPTGTSKKVGTSMIGAADNFTVTKDNMNQLKEQLQKAIRQTVHFEQFKDRIEMTVTSEGLRIELLEGKNGTFFENGVARPTEDGQEILVKLAQELGHLPNKVAIEGHTDSKPYAGDGTYGNWELSADRANSARRLMQENGIGARQVTQVRGYSDQRLRRPKEPEDPSNRRISLIVQHLVPPEDDDEKPGDAPAHAAAAREGRQGGVFAMLAAPTFRASKKERESRTVAQRTRRLPETQHLNVCWRPKSVRAVSTILTTYTLSVEFQK